MCCFSICVVCCALFVVRCVMCVVCCSLDGVGWLLTVACSVLLFVCCLSFVVYGLFGVW